MYNIKYVGESPSESSVKRIYFSCHPDDWQLYFDTVCSDIPSHYKSFASILYDENPFANYDESDYNNFLFSADLIIIPVTAKLLSTPSRSRDVDFAFATNNNIPVLPVLMEKGLEQQFNSTFGDLQLLDRTGVSDSFADYHKKLSDFLGALFLKNEEQQKIQSAFSGRIFLSYRQKDLSAAKKLMELLHSIEGCRDIAIWYDDFIVSGEDFNKYISDQLQRCDIFVMAVTPNLLEKGNYVIENEFPDAKKLNKPIFAVEVEPVDRSAFARVFGDDIPLVNRNDPDFAEKFSQLVADLDIGQKSDSLQQRYLMGLAYMDGLDVHKNPQKAVELIKSAHDDGYLPALEKLTDMYKHGLCVPKSPEKAVECYYRIIDILEEEYDTSPDYAKADRIIKNLLSACLLLNELKCADDILNLTEDAEYYYYQHLQDNVPSVLWNLHLIDALSLRQRAFIHQENYIQAEELAFETLSLLEDFYSAAKEYAYLRKQIICRHELYNLYNSIKLHSKAGQQIDMVVELSEQLVQSHNSDFDRKKLMESYIYAAEHHYSLKEYKKAGQYAQKAVFFGEYLDSEDIRIQLASAYSYLCRSCIFLDQKAKAEEIFDKAADLLISQFQAVSDMECIYDLSDMCLHAVDSDIAVNPSHIAFCISVLETVCENNPATKTLYFIFFMYAYGACCYAVDNEQGDDDYTVKCIENFEKLFAKHPGVFSGKGLSKLYYRLAVACFYIYDYQKSILYFDRYLEAAGVGEDFSAQNLTGCACKRDVLFYLTAIMIDENKFDLAMKYARYDIDWQESLDDGSSQARHHLSVAYNDMAYICYFLEMYAEALIYYEKIAQQEENIARLCNADPVRHGLAMLVLERLARICRLLNHPIKAAKYLKIAEKLHTDDSRIYVQESEAQLEENRREYKEILAAKSI